jgi:hypothetical protein
MRREVIESEVVKWLEVNQDGHKMCRFSDHNKALYLSLPLITANWEDKKVRKSLRKKGTRRRGKRETKRVRKEETGKKRQ